jgi:hypothetical protein
MKYKSKQVQVVEQDDFKERLYFCGWFLWAVPDDGLDPTFSFADTARLVGWLAIVSTTV